MKSPRNNKYLVPMLLAALVVFPMYGCGEMVTADLGGGYVHLGWQAPTENEDGSPLFDLAGFRIHYGQTSGQYTRTLDTGNYSECSVGGLSSGTWYFAVTAYDTSGNFSGLSNEVSTYVTDEI